MLDSDPVVSTPTRTLGADFGRRALTAFIGGPLVILVILLGGWVFALTVLIVALISSFELYTVVRLEKVRWTWWLYALVATFYIGLPLTLMAVLRNLPDGWAWVGVLFVTNWATDGFALIGGRLFGRSKLAPHISPGKTIEGAITGILCGALFGSFIAGMLGLDLRIAIVAALAVAILTVVGDLAESWLKRRLAVKDFGALLPGHGGLLDRIDGLLFAVIGLFFVLLLL